jgi:hypothetical protein
MMTLSDCILELYIGTLGGAFVLILIGILWWKPARPKPPVLGAWMGPRKLEEKKPSGRKFFVED